MSYKAVIFDLDGTLLDSIEDLADSMNVVLKGAGFPMHSIGSYKYFVGDGVRNLVFRALPENFKNEETITKFTEKMNTEYSDRWDAKTRPYNGIEELLNILEEKKIQIAVLSNKPDSFTKLMIKKLLPDWKFAAVYGQRSSIPKKPDPSGALEIAGILGLQPREILYLGDTDTDMHTANNAGMYAVGALWGFRDKDELIKNGAKTVINEPLDLLDLL